MCSRGGASHECRARNQAGRAVSCSAMLRAGTLGICVALASGGVACAGRAAPQKTSAPSGAAAVVGSPADGLVAEDAAALVVQGETALGQERAAEAVALFGRALARGGLDDDGSRAAYIGLAHAHEQLRDCAAAVRAFDAYTERFPAASDAAVVDAQRGACLAELGQWEASAASFARVATADGQLPSTRIEALARQGYALFHLDRFDDADAVLARADEVFERAEREQSERFGTYYFVGMARFYRGAILHRRFREVEIVLPENVMAERFKKKLELLTQAQERYNHAIRAKHMFWVSAAGFQLGHLFSELYDALMHAPVPDYLDAKGRRIYYEELEKQLRPVVDKAVWVLEKNLETARRLGYESDFIARTEEKLAHLQSVLHSTEATLGQPRSRLADVQDTEASTDAGDATAQTGAGSEPTPAEGAPASAVDRKLFVPPMTPLLP